MTKEEKQREILVKNGISLRYYPDLESVKIMEEYGDFIRQQTLEEVEREKQQELIRLVQVPGQIQNTTNGEWCQACGAWKQYGVADTHHCTGYKITCKH